MRSGQEYHRGDAVPSLVHLIKEVMVLMCFITGEVDLEHLRLCMQDFSPVKSLSFPLWLINILGERSLRPCKAHNTDCKVLDFHLFFCPIIYITLFFLISLDFILF